MRFTKMEGCGNDYVYINGFAEYVEKPSLLAKAVSDRHFGCGSDGLILILPSEKADVRMRMFNADGSESEMCGNGIRCVGKYAYEHHLTDKTELLVETLGGLKKLTLHKAGETVEKVTVDMGEPVFAPEDIPVLSQKNPVIGEPVKALDREFLFTCLSMGNPHAVTFLEHLEDFPVESYGPVLETESRFPNRANIEFIEILDTAHLKMRVWERGSGETMACGTGACAAVVAACLNGLCQRQAVVSLLGGELEVHWREADNHVYMTGPAHYTYEGVWLKE